MMKKIIIAGGTGFLGNALQEHFLSQGYQLCILTRSESRKEDGVNYQNWDGKELGDWIEVFENAEAVINLSGKNINCRHTEENKKAIIDSRVDSTNIIGKAIEKVKPPPKVWINASGISYYADSYDRQMTEENHEVGHNFIAEVVKLWEQALYQSNSVNCRRVALRIGVVLGHEGALKVLLKQTKIGLGGKHASGKQVIPWIHLDDIVGAIQFLIENSEIDYPVNACSPNPETDAKFMKTLRKVHGVPIGLPAPKFAIQLGAKILGTEADLILASTNAYPKRLLDAGYQFQFPTLKEAFLDLKKKNN